MKESVIFFHHVNSGHQTQGVRFVSRHLYLLSHLAIPDLMYFYITNGEVILARRDNQEVRKCRMETGEEWRSCGLMSDAEDTRVLGGMMSEQTVPCFMGSYGCADSFFHISVAW